MIREEIKQYMKENKDNMAYSHLEIYFAEQYQGVSKKECEKKLRGEHDNSLLYEELEEKFKNVSELEKSYAKNVFIKEVLSQLIFEGASVWIDSNLKEHK